MIVAITRPVSVSIADCQLTHLPRQRIDLERARAQHAAYESCLQSLGARIERVGAEPGLPDAVFIEDTAVVLERLAVIARPGAVSRRAETVEVAEVLKKHRPVVCIESSGTLDGGDVLKLGRRIFVGESSRTNAAGIEQLGAFARPQGYEVIRVKVTGCLHLKSAATAIAADRLLVNPDWLAKGAFAGIETIAIDPAEPMAANALLVGKCLIASSQYPRTAERLAKAGLRVNCVDMSELAKAEGALTCCSILLDTEK